MKLLKHGKRLPEDQALSIFRQLLDAVVYCHSRNCVHLDIKCENILVDPKSLQVALTDFGFARVTDLHQPMTNWCGSPYTVSPEILLKKPYDGRKVDAWSLGSVLYTILCGRFPFQAASINRVFTKTLKGLLLPFHPAVSVRARDLVEKLLNPDPRQRFSLDQAREHPWMAICLPRRISYSTSTSQSQTRNSRKRLASQVVSAPRAIRPVATNRNQIRALEIDADIRLGSSTSPPSTLLHSHRSGSNSISPCRIAQHQVEPTHRNKRRRSPPQVDLTAH